MNNIWLYWCWSPNHSHALALHSPQFLLFGLTQSFTWLTHTHTQKPDRGIDFANSLSSGTWHPTKFCCFFSTQASFFISFSICNDVVFYGSSLNMSQTHSHCHIHFAPPLSFLYKAFAQCVNHTLTHTVIPICFQAIIIRLTNSIRLLYASSSS